MGDVLQGSEISISKKEDYYAFKMIICMCIVKWDSIDDYLCTVAETYQIYNIYALLSWYSLIL